MSRNADLTRTKNRRQIITSRLREARERAGLSQGQVARMLNMHRPTITEIEAGNRNVSAEELARFADVYQVAIEWLFGRAPQARRSNGSARDQQTPPTEWTEEKNARRCQLIDRKVQDVITAEEDEELDRLQQALRQHLDHVAPLNLDAAKRLHAKLLGKRRVS